MTATNSNHSIAVGGALRRGVEGTDASAADITNSAIGVDPYEDPQVLKTRFELVDDAKHIVPERVALNCRRSGNGRTP